MIRYPFSDDTFPKTQRSRKEMVQSWSIYVKVNPVLNGSLSNIDKNFLGAGVAQRLWNFIHVFILGSHLKWVTTWVTPIRDEECSYQVYQ